MPNINEETEVYWSLFEKSQDKFLFFRLLIKYTGFLLRFFPLSCASLSLPHLQFLMGWATTVD